MDKVKWSLVKTDIHPDLYKVKGLPTDEKKANSVKQTVRNASKREVEAGNYSKVHERSNVGLFVATSEDASTAFSEAHPITGRGPKATVNLSEMIAEAKS